MDLESIELLDLYNKTAYVKELNYTVSIECVSVTFINEAKKVYSKSNETDLRWVRLI